MKICNVTDDNLNEVLYFLGNVATIPQVDIEITKNAMVVKEEEDIIGILSFEKFGKIGLVRYFVFNKIVNDEIVKELIEGVAQKAISQGVTTFLTLVMREDVTQILKMLGFIEIEKNDVFIDEELIGISKYPVSKVLKLELKKEDNH